MVIVLWVLGILAVLLTVLCCLRLGAHIQWNADDFKVNLTVGPFHVQVFPQKKKKEKLPPEQGTPKSQSTKKKPDLSIVKDIWKSRAVLFPPLKKALERTRKGIRIQPMTLSVTVGGQADPASAAQCYGWIHSAVWTCMPVLEQLLTIPDPRIHIEIDFDAAETKTEGDVGISLRIGTLLRVAFGVLPPWARWMMRRPKEQKPTTSTEKKKRQERTETHGTGEKNAAAREKSSSAEGTDAGDNG